MTTYLTHTIIETNIFYLKDNLDNLLYPLNYNNEIDIVLLQDKLVEYYIKRYTELYKKEKKVNKEECIEFALESLIQYLNFHTSYTCEYSIKFTKEYTSIALLIKEEDKLKTTNF